MARSDGASADNESLKLLTGFRGGKRDLNVPSQVSFVPHLLLGLIEL